MSRSKGLIRWGLAGALVVGGAAITWWLYGSAHAVEAAKQAAEQQDWAAAEGRLKVYLALHPGAAPVRLRLAQMLLNQSKLDEAVAQLRLIPDQDPAGMEARLNESAILLFGLGRAAQAERALRAALALDPESPGAYRGLRQVYSWEDREAEGVPLLWKLYRVDRREQCEVLAQLFRLQYAEYALSEIEPRIRRFIANDPGDADAQVALAKLQRRRKKLEDARALLESLRLPAGHLEGRSVLLDCYLDLGDAARARALLDAWPETERQDLRYRRSLGIYQQAYAQQWDQAVQTFGQVLADAPDDWEVRHRMGICLQMLGRTREADRELHAADWAEHYMSHDRMKRLLGTLDAPRLDEPATRLGIARFCEKVGRRREARCWYEQTLAVAPNDPSARAGVKRLVLAGPAGKTSLAQSP